MWSLDIRAPVRTNTLKKNFFFKFSEENLVDNNSGGLKLQRNFETIKDPFDLLRILLYHSSK